MPTRSFGKNKLPTTLISSSVISETDFFAAREGGQLLTRAEPWPVVMADGVDDTAAAPVTATALVYSHVRKVMDPLTVWTLALAVYKLTGSDTHIMGHPKHTIWGPPTPTNP